MFEGLPNVLILKLEDNQIVNINESAFKNLGLLKKLVRRFETTFYSIVKFKKSEKIYKI